MILTLPAIELARVADAPSAVLVIGGVRFGAHVVSEAVHIEAPVVVAHCSRCKVAGDRAVASCIATDCPSRARRAA